MHLLSTPQSWSVTGAEVARPNVSVKPWIVKQRYQITTQTDRIGSRVYMSRLLGVGFLVVSAPTHPLFLGGPISFFTALGLLETPGSFAKDQKMTYAMLSR